MFTLLLESRAATVQQVRGRTGGSAGSTAVSVLIHGALATTLILLTATHDRPAEKAPPQERLRITTVDRPKDPTPPATTTPATAVPNTAPSIAAAPLVPALPTIIDIPNTIPAIDLSRAPTSEADFATGRRGSPLGVPGGTGTGSVVPSTNGYFSEAQVEKPVMVLPGKGPAFPEVLRSVGTQGTVLAQFVVDSTGRVIVDTFTALQSDHPLFTASVRSALTRMRFVPAEIAGRRVVQLVQQPFQFTLH